VADAVREPQFQYYRADVDGYEREFHAAVVAGYRSGSLFESGEIHEL